MEYASGDTTLDPSALSVNPGLGYTTCEDAPSQALEFTGGCVDITLLDTQVWNSTRAAEPHTSVILDGWHTYDHQIFQPAVSPVAATTHLPQPEGVTETHSAQHAYDYRVENAIIVQGASAAFASPQIHPAFDGVVSSAHFDLPACLNDAWLMDGYYPSATTPSSPIPSMPCFPSDPLFALVESSHLVSPIDGFTRRRSVSEPTSFAHPTAFAQLSSSDYDRQPQQVFTTRRRNAAVPAPYAPCLSANRWKCPFCTYVQKGRRAQDLRRHIATHTRPTDVALWSCCGVPISQARLYGVTDARVAAAEATPIEFVGDELMAGGCGQSFSRRDALQRHLREKKGACFGDAAATWHPGNITRRNDL